MIGKEATLKDIVLEEQAVPLDPLWCEEQLPDEEEEVEVEQVPAPNPFRVTALCGRCGRAVRLVVLATAPGVRGLEELLWRDLRILCPPCGSAVRYQHGG
nr:MAG: E7 protein [Leptonychotes weddellii papillomavirus 10]